MNWQLHAQVSDVQYMHCPQTISGSLGTRLTPHAHAASVMTNSSYELRDYVGDWVAGTVGGCVGAAVAQPFDTMKGRLQTEGTPGLKLRYGRMMKCFHAIRKTEGIRGFYKGLASPLVGQGIITLVLFGVEGNVQKGYIEHHLPPSVHPVTSPFISGMIAGMAQSFFICPMDLIKIRVQHQGIGERTESRSLKSIMFSDHSCNNKPLRGPIIVVKNTYRTGGLTGYYRGILPTFLGNGIGGGIYFSAYGNIKLQLHRRVFTESELLPSFIAGGLAGVCSYTPLYYLDVMKGRLQIDGEHGERQYKGLVDCFLKTYKEGGVRLLYKGLTPLLLWISTFGAAVFPTVEFVKMQFSSSKAGET